MQVLIITCLYRLYQNKMLCYTNIKLWSFQHKKT